MEKLTIYLDDGTYDGAVLLNSTLSNIKAIRVKREEMKNFSMEFQHSGIYFLFDDDEVYVGQTSLNTLENRINSTHTGDIDSRWKSVLAFPFINTISTNELLFLENALCEYAHENFSKCLTQSPSKAICNAKHRNQSYHLNTIQIMACYHYLDDIKFYISLLPKKTPEKISQEPQNATLEGFYYRNNKSGVSGEALILIHTGDKKKRKTIIKAGATISENVSPNFPASQAVIEKRKELQQKGILVNRVLLEDVELPSQTFAAEFLYGNSVSGNEAWLSIKENVKLNNLLI